MVRLARERVGSRGEVRHMRIEDVAWQKEFNGIWACASLLHVPVVDFPGATTRLAAALRPGGALEQFSIGLHRNLRRRSSWCTRLA